MRLLFVSCYVAAMIVAEARFLGRNNHSLEQHSIPIVNTLKTITLSSRRPKRLNQIKIARVKIVT